MIRTGENGSFGEKKFSQNVNRSLQIQHELDRDTNKTFEVIGSY